MLEELSWLYSDSPETCAQRSTFRREISDSTVFLLVSNLYAGVVSSLVEPLLPDGHRLSTFGYRSNIAAMTRLGSLLESQCSWMQIAANALDLLSEEGHDFTSDEILQATKVLLTLDQNAREELTQGYDDPEWYWARQPDELLGSRKGGQRK